MTLALKIIDQELAQFGWVESIATNSISDFKSPKSNVLENTTDEKDSDLIDIYFYHLIFYVIFCYSLFIYIFVDLGLDSLVKQKTTTFINFIKKSKIAFFITKLTH